MQVEGTASLKDYKLVCLKVDLFCLAGSCRFRNLSQSKVKPKLLHGQTMYTCSWLCTMSPCSHFFRAAAAKRPFPTSSSSSFSPRNLEKIIFTLEKPVFIRSAADVHFMIWWHAKIKLQFCILMRPFQNWAPLCSCAKRDICWILAISVTFTLQCCYRNPSAFRLSPIASMLTRTLG